MQTIYTQITHADGCPGCLNVTYQDGGDTVVAACNECGFVAKTVPIEP